MRSWRKRRPSASPSCATAPSRRRGLFGRWGSAGVAEAGRLTLRRCAQRERTTSARLFALACAARQHAPELLLPEFWVGRAGAGPLVAPLLESHATDGLLRRELTLQSFAERHMVTAEGSRHRVLRARLDNEWFALKEFTEVRGERCASSARVGSARVGSARVGSGRVGSGRVGRAKGDGGTLDRRWCACACGRVRAWRAGRLGAAAARGAQAAQAAAPLRGGGGGRGVGPRPPPRLHDVALLRRRLAAAADRARRPLGPRGAPALQAGGRARAAPGLLCASRRCVAARAQLLLAVEHIHRCDEVHCDIKPDNVFLTGDEAGNEVRVRRAARRLALCTLQILDGCAVAVDAGSWATLT